MATLDGYVRVSGVWKRLDPRVNVSGTYKEIVSGYERVSGVWKQLYSRAAISLPDGIGLTGFYVGGDPPFMASTITISNDGTMLSQQPDGGGPFSHDWMLPNGAVPESDYDIRLTKSSGDDPDSGTLATWLNLGTTRSFQWSFSGYDSRSFEGTLEIRESSSGSVIDSCSVSISMLSSAA